MRADVVVVGAGVAGCTVARILAGKGHDVALVELKSEESIGEKVCGDGVAKRELERVGYIPRGEDIECRVKGIQAYDHKGERLFAVTGEGYTLDRKSFGQTLLTRAQDAGVTLYHRTLATAPLTKRSHMIGLEVRDLHSRRKKKFKALITVDASGVATAMRRKLPSDWWPSEKILPHVLGLGYREIRKTESEAIDSCHLYYDWTVAPGGYLWVIPKRTPLCNAGILTSPPPGDATTLKNALHRFAESNAILKGSTPVEGAFGVVPMTKPLSCPVWDGFLTVGDAANHPNPSNGGGIGPALEAAEKAAEAASAALSVGSVTTEILWAYPKSFMRTRGAKHAASATLKDLMYSLTSDQVECLLSCLGIRGEYTTTDLLKEVSTTDKIRIFAKMAKDPRLLLATIEAVGMMRAVRDYYEAYPETSAAFPQWSAIHPD